MEWQRLVGFYYTVKLGSFTRAAEATFRSQSALSQQVKKLEEELQAVLLERTGRHSIRLTPAGQALYRYAEKNIDAEQQFRLELSEIKNESIGGVSIAASKAIIQLYLLHPLRQFCTENPKVFLSIMHNTPQETLELLQRGGIDFGIMHSSAVPGNMHKTPWKQGKYCLVVPKGHALSQCEKEVSLAQIVEYPLCLTQKHVKFTSRPKFDAALEEAGLTCQVLLETTSIFLAAMFVKHGLGLAFMFCYDEFIRIFEESLVFIDMKHIFPPEKLSIVRRKDQWMCPSKTSFLETIVNC